MKLLLVIVAASLQEFTSSSKKYQHLKKFLEKFYIKPLDLKQIMPFCEHHSKLYSTITWVLN